MQMSGRVESMNNNNKKSTFSKKINFHKIGKWIVKLSLFCIVSITVNGSFPININFYNLFINL